MTKASRGASRRLSFIALCVVLQACTQDANRRGSVSGGDPQRGSAAIRQYGCGSCHRITGIAGADGNTGPPLSDLARRVYLAGVLANTPENLVRWIRHPQQVSAITAMPDMKVTEADARHIAAYLYSN